MKYIIILLVTAIFFSCSPKTLPLKGSYMQAPFTTETNTPVDKVWDKLIDLFAQRGLSIKIIDRSSGLIISERYQMPVTTESNAGKIKDSNAFIVVPTLYDPGSRKYNPKWSGVKGEWNVRIKSVGDKTVINVNVVNITATSLSMYAGRFTSTDVDCLECKSTGVFENIIAEKIK